MLEAEGSAQPAGNRAVSGRGCVWDRSPLGRRGDLHLDTRAGAGLDLALVSLWNPRSLPLAFTASRDSCDEGPAGGSVKTRFLFQPAPLIGSLPLGRIRPFNGLQPPFLEAGGLFTVTVSYCRAGIDFY